MSELVAADPPERMEEIVQAYQRKPPKRHWEPVEFSQIVAISRVDDAESEAWGKDGGSVVEWFDQGELMHAWPTAPSPQMNLSPVTRGFARVVAWFKGWVPKPDSLELASAEY